MFRFCALISVLGPVLLNAAEPTREQTAFFERKIRPVLVASCYECHSAKAVAAKALKGGLLLDTRAGALKGGESGPAVVPGRLDESLLIAAVKYDGLEMPPKGKLPDDVVADFEKWVEMGAPDPRDGSGLEITATEIDLEEGRKHWAYQPLATDAPPRVDVAEWMGNPVDRFVRARQEAAGIEPNDRATAATLIRRLHYDLVGLPPTPERVASFVADAERDFEAAYGQLVDELLASERHGERWARHWLDVVRFAESNGYAFDKDRPNAWRYRDFVIRALNDDLPYDEFVRLQIAGDLLSDVNVKTGAEAARALRNVSATGFVVAGPFTTQQTQKERERSRYEQLDDIVHTMGTSMLGMTVGCCRCHDHKYDALPTSDYYRLAACFADVGFSDTAITANPEEYADHLAKFESSHAPLVTARTAHEQAMVAGFETWLKARSAGGDSPDVVEFTLAAWQHAGPFPAGDMNAAFAEAFPPEQGVDLAATYRDGKVKWTPHADWRDGVAHNTLTGDNSANYLFRVVESPDVRSLALSLGSDDAIKVWVNGKPVLEKNVAGAVQPDAFRVEVPLRKGRNELLMKIVNGGGPSGFYFAATSAVPFELPGLGEWHHVGPFVGKDLNSAFDTAFGPETSLDELDLAATFEGDRLKWTARPEWTDGTVHEKALWGASNGAHYLARELVLERPRAIALSLGSHDAIKVWLNGREVLAKKVTRKEGAAAGQERVTLQVPAGRNVLLMKIANAGGESGFYFQPSGGLPPKDVADVLALEPAKWNGPQRAKALGWYRGFDAKWLDLNDAVVTHDKTRPQPAKETVYAAKTRGSTYNFGGDTYKVYQLRRGNADNKQDEATPGFLRILVDPETDAAEWLQGEAEKPRASRIALADWMTDAEQGAGHLLARVIVNRLWQHHFGRGLVATPNDFGVRGERPSHPALLDFLASELIRGEWRLKPIHRLIVTSRTYQLGIVVNETNQKLDPDNALLWRREPRRLEAEPIRDGLLAIAGDLDTMSFGKGTLDQNSRRRSIYLTVKRSQLIPFLQLFDAPGTMQGVGQREESTVSPQALAMINSSFVRGLATKFATRVRPNAETSIEDALRAAHRTALAREASAEEVAALTGFVAAQKKLRGDDANAETLAFRDVCHLLVCSNEFLYVD